MVRFYLRKMVSGDYDFVERREETWYINGSECPFDEHEIKEVSIALYEVDLVRDKNGNLIKVHPSS